MSAATCLVAVRAERDIDNGTNATVIAVQPSSGMVAIEVQGRTRKGIAVQSVEPQRAIGEIAGEASAAVAASESHSTGAHSGLESHPVRTEAVNLFQPVFLKKAAGESSVKDSHSSAAVPQASDVSSAKKEQPHSSLESDVKLALKALIKSRSSQQSGAAKAPTLPPAKPQSAGGFSKQELDASSLASSAQGVVQGHTQPEAQLQQPVARDHNKQEQEPESKDHGKAEHQAVAADIAMNVSDKIEVETSEDADGLQEVMLSTSTAAPDEVVEELERESTSILSVVFFTYLLLSLAALAACTAFMTHTRAEDSEELTEKDKWRHVLRYGSFGEAKTICT